MSVRILPIIVVLLTPLVSIADPPAKTRLDAHGFPLPDGAICRLGDLRFAQPSEIIALAISPDDKVIATAGHWHNPKLSRRVDHWRGVAYFETTNEGKIYLWDVRTGRIIREFKAPPGISKMTFGSNGRLLATVENRGRVLIWDTKLGKSCWNKGVQIGQSADRMASLRFFEDDGVLAVCRSDYRVSLWNVKNEALVREWRIDTRNGRMLQHVGEKHWAIGFALSPSGKRMACLARKNGSDKDHDILICDTRSGDLLRRVTVRNAHANITLANHVHLLDEGNTILFQIVGLGECSNVIIDAASGRERFRFEYRTFPREEIPATQILDVAPKFGSLLTQYDNGVTHWDIVTGKILARTSEQCACLQFFNDGKQLAIARGARLQLCDTNLKPLAAYSKLTHAGSLSYSAQGNHLISAVRDREIVWDITKQEIIKRLPIYPMPKFSGPPPTSTDRRRTRLVHYEKSGYVVRDLVNNRQLCRLDGVEAIGGDYAVFPLMCSDGNRVLIASAVDAAILVRWHDSTTGRELGRYHVPKAELFPSELYPLAWYSSDGSVFGYLQRNNQLVLVDCRSRDTTVVGVSAASPQLQSNKRYTNPKWTFHTDASGDFLVQYRFAGGSRHLWVPRREYAVWEKATGKLFRRFTPKDEDSMFQLSPDGRTVGIRKLDDNRVTLIETATGRRRGEVCAPTAVEHTRFAPDGKTLAASCADTTILIWDINRPLNNRPAMKFGATETHRELIWKMLADHDAEAADQAIWAMVRSPRCALPFLEKRVAPVHMPDPKLLQNLIATLGSQNFKEREIAANKLIRLGELAIPALRASLKTGNLEQVRRAKKIIEHIEDPANPPPCLREIRAIEVLERIGSEKAIQVLRRLASGTVDSLATREARLALTRLEATR